MIITLQLIVIRSSDMAKAAAFYTQLGFLFTLHRHGEGVEHYAAELPGAAFEIYPLADGAPPTTGARLGFGVPSLSAAIASLDTYPGAVIQEPKDSPWGKRAVIVDPDGHRVELVQQQYPQPTA